MQNKIYAFWFILLSVVVVGCASHSSRPELKIPSAEKRLYILKHRLSLSDEQMIEIRPILDEEYRRKTDIIDGSGNSRSERSKLHQQMEDLEWDIYVKLSKILTEKQVELYLDYVEEQKAKMKESVPDNSERGQKRGGDRRR